MSIGPKKGKYFTMTCLFSEGETAAKVMAAAGNNFIAGEWHDSRPAKAMLDQLAEAIDLMDECMDTHIETSEMDLHIRMRSFINGTY
jgi:hypothetical protein